MMMISTEITGRLPCGVSRSFIDQMVSAAYRASGGKGGAHVAISIVDDYDMRRLNRQYRGKDKTTDVLSFPYLEDEHFIEVTDEEGSTLIGEIVISAEQIKRQAKEYSRNIRAEFALMLVHGVLHLMGFDHITPEAEAKMFALQHEILAKEDII